MHPVRQIITFLYELCQQITPLAAKDVGPCEAAVSAAHAHVGDAFLHQVKGSSEPALTGGEGLASSGAYHGPTLAMGQRGCWPLEFSITHVFSTTVIFPEIWVSQYQWKLDADRDCVSDHQAGLQVCSACLQEVNKKKKKNYTCYKLMLMINHATHCFSNQ